MGANATTWRHGIADYNIDVEQGILLSVLNWVGHCKKENTTLAILMQRAM